MSGRRQVAVTVTVADGADLAAVADRLRDAGMTVEQVLDAVGIITGTVPGRQRRSIEGVAGVTAVEDEHMFQLPPPDADVQ